MAKSILCRLGLHKDLYLGLAGRNVGAPGVIWTRVWQCKCCGRKRRAEAEKSYLDELRRQNSESEAKYRKLRGEILDEAIECLNHLK